jgi:mono/diheme cytochrome c family protein
MDSGKWKFHPMKLAGVIWIAALLSGLFALFSSASMPTNSQSGLIAKGKEIFFNETFNGNGRTCGTCHPAENNFTLDPAFIATLPPNNPLFVAEFNSGLKKNFENPRLMRQFALILENLDGFDDLENKFVMRGIPHLLALQTSVNSLQGPRTGWSGDGAPGDGSLRSFATGAVIQHFTKTLNRIPGVDFRLPTDEELDALEAFQLSLGRQQDLTLPLPLKGTVPKRGQAIFLDNGLGKCNLCHVNAGATANLGGGNIGNANFNTGIEDLPDQPADLTGELVPPDDGFGTPGDGTFNTPPW